MVFVLLLILTVTVPAFASVQHENVSLCRIEEYNCSNGQCIGLEHVCDGIPDCLDGTDEKTCGGYADTALGNKRDKRQSQQRCRSGQWQCRDRSCINFDGVCDGVVDCRDHSDETFALCRNTTCQSNWFRCTYGACVDGTAPCNDLQECADNSDELLPRCRNDTNGSLGQYFCANGQVIPSTDLCDGVQNCLDGTDETLRACADKLCPSYLFQCAYGACVDNGSGCNGVVDCADGSDESAELCRPNEVVAITTTTAAPPVSSEICVLPEYPLHGSYSVGGDAKARPGQLFQTAFLSYSCSAGYGLENDLSFVYCNHGTWNTDFPKCIRLCRLNKHPGVEYRCLLTGNRGEEGSRECNVFEPTGTVAQPSCNKPNYYSKSFLSLMRCQDGSWDKDPICEAECGTLTPNGTKLVSDGWDAQRGEVSWHAGIYRTTTRPFKQICGGSIVSTTVVISAAHCFWKDVDKKQPASHYAVAVGKLYRGWNNPNDTDAQKSEVSDIRIPPKFLGAANNFQEDIAMVILKTAIRYETYVRPVCLDFDYGFDSRQLHVGNRGKVAGWGLTSANGEAASVLQVATIPYVDFNTCLENSPRDFREFITSDKICAGYTNGTALCQGDSGGGLAFPSEEKGIQRYYLRGIVSTAPRNDDKCTLFSLTSFTQIIKHEHFIKESL